MSELGDYMSRFYTMAERLTDFQKTKLLENEYEAGLYQSLVHSSLRKLGFKNSEIRFKLSKKKFLWIFETSKVYVYTELLTDDIISAIKIIE